MEFLHIIPGSTGNLLEFLGCMENRDDFNEHRFMTMVTREGIIKGCPEMLAYPFIENFEKYTGRFRRIRDYFSLRRRLMQADRIIWHGLTTGGGKFTLLLFLNKQICAKSVWIENGADEDSWTQYGSALKRRLFNHIQKTVRKKIPVVGVTFPANEAYVKELWPDKTVFDTPYPINADYMKAALDVRRSRIGKKPFVESEALNALEEGSVRFPAALPSVQIGMNSQALNVHTRLIVALNSKRESPINFFLPMNYRLEKMELSSGAAGYKKRIVLLSRGKFKKRGRVLNRRVSAKAYFNFLYKMDVAVLNGKVSFASSYFWLLLASGVKLYFPGDSYIYTYFLENGVPVHALEDIENESYEEFFSGEDCSSVPDVLRDHLEPENVMDHWTKLFSFLKTEQGV